MEVTLRASREVEATHTAHRRLDVESAPRPPRAPLHVPQLHLACVAHALNGPHHRCLAETVGALLDEKDAFPKREHQEAAGEPVEVDCLVESEPLAHEKVAAAVGEAI